MVEHKSHMRSGRHFTVIWIDKRSLYNYTHALLEVWIAISVENSSFFQQ